MDQLLARLQFDPKATRGAQLDPIPWPGDYSPAWKLIEGVTDTDPLPHADVLVVTYTVAEGQALADVLTPGHPSSSWTPYRNGWGALKARVGPHGPSHHSDRAGSWAVTKIGNATAVLVKSELHPSTDGPLLPMADLWVQMIEQVNPALVITTGTAGGVGADTLLGDVIVTSSVRWDCSTKFRSAPWAETTYRSDAGQHILETAPVQAFLGRAQQELMPVNAGRLPAADRLPAVLTSTTDNPLITISTDFFAFDDVQDHYRLRVYENSARAVEMDDAAIGVAVSGRSSPPAWLSVRNASDPQISGPTLKIEAAQAAGIYRRFGYYTTSCSALACWALIAGISSS